ncbi:hypothetical protein F441_03266 [Phytophthora nicotianae CJ01A1]|uniref:Endonuclease/exonuclease/phosphatase domain-containing protein n=1 Tax=Phytophthora nicotianae CJ01A1 TaxID=1317063 RepID=W2XNX5_PHYNI|nr:hypothetical protein F441_03266 [Phytophthora nicotianae CJ01A1]
MWPEPDCPEPAKSTSCKGFPPRYILRVAEQGSKFTGRSPVFFFGTGFRVSTRKSHTALERYLSTIVSTFNRRDITFITGDFNAKLGNRVTGETFLGVHARGRRNRNGHALAAFCDAFQFFAANTAFKKRARNKTTWTQRRNEHIVYNHIDYVLCPQNCRRLCQDAQSWGGTLTASDHKLNGTLQRVQDAATETIGYTTSDPRRTRRYNDAVLAKLSEQQRTLRLQIYNDRSTNTAALRARRNRLLHEIRSRCQALANAAIDEKVSRIEAASDSHKMFTAVRDHSVKQGQQLLLRDESGKYILSPEKY